MGRTGMGAALRARAGRRCVLCLERPATAGLCEPCRADLPWLPGARCPRCALPTAGGTICGNCLRDPPAFDGIAAVVSYAFPVDALIGRLKYAGELMLAPVLGDLLGTVARLDPVPDLVLPIPLASDRLRHRGFNQTLEIARALPPHLAQRVTPHLLVRRHDSPPQASLPLDARAANVRNAFACAGDLAGRSVAIVDDVMTTGATLDAAAKVLRRAGASSVRGWIVARTLRDP